MMSEVRYQQILVDYQVPWIVVLFHLREPHLLLGWFDVRSESN